MNNKENTNLKVMDTEENEIDLVIIYRILKRNKSFIFKFSISILIISCIFSLIKRRVWEGQFEIVISQNNNNKQLSNNQLLQNFVNLDLLNNSNSQTLNTEVGILKSPSVLMPIFNFVNNEKSNFKKGSKVLNFSTWQNKNLKIDLRKRTSILNITYRDTNKEIIIPVLEKISSTYQNYSGLQNKRNFEITKNF